MSQIDFEGFDVPIDEVIEHFGVRGMRWGVRRRMEDSNSPERSSVDISKSKARKKAGLKLLGGAVAVGAVFVGANYLAKRAGENKRAKVNVLKNTRQGMAYMARGKGWMVETNSADAFEIAMRTVRERGGL